MSNEELVTQIQQGINPSANMEALYINNKPYIYQIAKKYMNYADIEDLMQEAYFGLYEAVQRYENSHEVLFMTYAGFWINQSISRYVGNNSKSVRIPIGMQGRMYQYNKVINLYESKLHRKPTERELCAHLSIDSKSLKELRSATARFNHLGSLDTALPGTEDMFLSDVVPGNTDIENEVIDKIMNSKINTELWDIVKTNTTEDENTVIIARFKKNLSLEETGKSIGQTRDKARNLEAKALRKLRHSRCSREIRDKFEVNYARAYRGSLGMFKSTWTSSTENAAMKNLELEYNYSVH